MAKKAEATPVERAKLLVSREEAASKINDRVLQGQTLLMRPCGSREDLEQIRRDYYRWTNYNRDLLLSLFTTDEYAKRYVGYPMGAVAHRDLDALVKDVHADIEEKNNHLQSLIERLDLIPLASPPDSRQNVEDSRMTTDVFIVHGHDKEMEQAVARVLSRLGLDPIILHEQPNNGQTIIEKFETNAIRAGFVVVLLSPDDVGYPANKPKAKKPRARQNVILELGYFVGKLGRKYVFPLKRGEVEVPSDYQGVAYIDYDASGAWRLKLVQELQEAGYDVDANALTK